MLYLDTSAFLKLFTREPEGQLIAALLDQREDELVSSFLLDVEASRAAGRIGGDAPIVVDQALARIRRVQISATIVANAALLLPKTQLGALAAIHLATAMAIPESTTVLTYDLRLQDACRQVGLPVLAPA